MYKFKFFFSNNESIRFQKKKFEIPNEDFQKMAEVLEIQNSFRL